jgi:hypothetical protein
MINLSLVVGLPDSWKVAVITMVPKKISGSSNPDDYRGISLLSCVGKLAERVVRNRLYGFLESIPRRFLWTIPSAGPSLRSDQRIRTK